MASFGKMVIQSRRPEADCLQVPPETLDLQTPTIVHCIAQSDTITTACFTINVSARESEYDWTRAIVSHCPSRRTTTLAGIESLC